MERPLKTEMILQLTSNSFRKVKINCYRQRDSNILQADMETRLIFSVGFVVSVLIHISEANSTCTVNDIFYICKHISNKADFPLVLPANIPKVTLMGTKELDGSFPDGLFNHQTWANVSELSVLEFSKADCIRKGFLNGLEELKFLSISSCPDLDNIDPDVFHSTSNLEALHLDENQSLKISIVEAALNGKLSKLKYLSLIGIQANKRHIVLGENFSKALRGKNLTYLDLSGVNIIYVEHDTIQEIFLTLKYLNLSYSKIVVKTAISFQSWSFIQNIELVDITGCQTFKQNYVIQEEKTVTCNFPLKAIYMFLQDMMFPGSQLRINAQYSFVKICDLTGLKMLDLSKNNIIILNITFSGAYDFHTLETLDLASNKMEYISSSFLSSFSLLKILDLSNNQLHNMQTMDDFANVFSKNKDLEIIFLRNNYLSVVPSNLFSSNTKLQIIDLSENELTYFNIELHNTWDLKLINLRKNRLKSLPVPFFGQLEQIFRHQTAANKKQKTSMTDILLSHFQNRNLIAEIYSYESNANENVKLTEKQAIIPQYVMINLLENPIFCDCHTLDLLKWNFLNDISIVNRTSLVCKYGNNEDLLHNATLELVIENCRLAIIIGIGIASSAAIILCLVTFVIIIHLRRRKARQNQDLENLKREILQDNTNFNFVVFLSYCSQDSDIVEENILLSLNRYLKEKLNTEKDLVCTGLDSFVPGMRIINEIHRCISESLVVVPIITPAFLQSHWSQEECVAAIDRHRQVVILMKHHTDTSKAIATIQNQIQQYTRATWSDNEGHFVIHPSWNTICERIIHIAIETLRNYRRQNLYTSNVLHPLLEESV